MAYLIQAFISKDGNPNLLPLSIPYLALVQGFVLAPVNKNFRDRFNLSIFPLLEGDNTGLLALSSVGCLVSENAKVAYIEAEFFGGDGMQASMVFENGKITLDKTVSRNAINSALHYLGVEKLTYIDEFEALRLGKYRNTEQWITTKNE